MRWGLKGSIVVVQGEETAIDNINIGMSISAKEALKLIAKNAANPKFKIIDVRTQAQRLAAHIPNSEHIPLNEIPQKMGSFNQDQTYLIYCRSGIRSLNAAIYLNQRGFKAINLEGGILEWQSLDQDANTSGLGDEPPKRNRQ